MIVTKIGLYRWNGLTMDARPVATWNDLDQLHESARAYGWRKIETTTNTFSFYYRDQAGRSWVPKGKWEE